MSLAFREWSDNGLSPNLASIGAIGRQALEYLASDRPAPETWIAEQKKSLDDLEKPSGEVVLAAVRPVRLLVEAAAKKR